MQTSFPSKRRARIPPVTMSAEGPPREWVTPELTLPSPHQALHASSGPQPPPPFLTRDQDWTESLWPHAQPQSCPKWALREACGMKQPDATAKIVTLWRVIRECNQSISEKEILLQIN